MSKRTCTECNIEKEIEKFAINSHGREGRSARCKSCANFWSKEYRKTDRQKLSEKAWRASYNGRKRLMLAAARQHAKNRGFEFRIGLEDFEIPEFCPILGVPLTRNIGNPGPDSASLDRIDDTLGYIPGNVHVISYKANRMKNDASPEELLEFADWVLKTFGDT